ncbi:bZIP transcription factor LALA0_S01e10088g [Lachancea lanzarotensis]|uniref:LALA0S01e10088g1_1 n=1 Tax=Lachancea lanzarotensis TaxID=1245769 RepID=A0A0C7N4J8_9SACH|nr:uncharacterized protein LALA0_S01e10088g [Lachancea lanzarotensis]CEP60406.1 LALA0S01e10088g1_1 [Lachancea lanzarotensis]
MASIERASPNLSKTTSSGLIRTSKTWVLPPRTRPGRRPKTSWQEEEVGPAESSKKTRNRDAQRAFRERQSKQLEKLDQEVMKWREKCAFYKQEMTKYAEQVKRMEQEIQELKSKGSRRENLVEKCDLCTHDLCICRDAELDAIIAALTPSLRDKIDTFKPMQAVALPQSLQAPARKRRKLKPQEESETVQVPNHSAAVVSESLAFQVDNEGCGFCSESSACLCKDDLIPQSNCLSTHKRLLKPTGM